MEPILIYADPGPSDEQAANVVNSCRKYKPQPVLVLNETRSKRTEASWRKVFSVIFQRMSFSTA
jgi:hypothetical protein